MPPIATPRHGFTLVELSIVLLIIGLITGGVLVGTDLIRNAELRAVTTEFAEHQTAIIAFRGKYFSLPGDMTNATDFWGAMTNCGAASPSGTGTQTCNGDGNGFVETGTVSQTAEAFTFWQHLANADLVKGAYNGITGAANVYETNADNAPSSSLSPGLWASFYLDATGWNSSYTWDKNNGNMLELSSVSALFSSAEVGSIDEKIDDGVPGTGNVNVAGWDNCTDATSDTQYTANYLFTDTTKQCNIRFPQAF